MSIGNRTLDNTPEISIPQYCLNLVENTEGPGGPGAKEQDHLNTDPQRPRTDTQRGGWAFPAAEDAVQTHTGLPPTTLSYLLHMYFEM